jgi:hypothetical protein
MFKQKQHMVLFEQRLLRLQMEEFKKQLEDVISKQKELQGRIDTLLKKQQHLNIEQYGLTPTVYTRPPPPPCIQCTII